MSTKPRAFEHFPSELAVPYGPYRAVVEDVIDGDTITVTLSLGVDVYAFARIRVRGINADELTSKDPLKHQRAWDAKAYAGMVLPLGTQVIVRSYALDAQPKSTEQQRSFIRWIGDIALSGQRDFASLMLVSGLVSAMKG